MLSYTITPNTAAHTYRVQLTFNPLHANHSLKLPVWIPGSYMLREFSKNIISIKAYQNNRLISCTQITKNTWNLTNQIDALVEVIYVVYAYELGIRSAYLDNLRGYFNNTSLCLFVVGLENIPHTLYFKSLPRSWQVATGLNALAKNKFVANNYAELIDCPCEIGSFTRFEFKVNGTPHYLILSGSIVPNFDQNRLLEDISKICTAQVNLFGGSAPFLHYTFMLYLGGEVFTGLEHNNSTALMAPYYALPQRHEPEISIDYQKLLGLISHEYFHAWNVKRIKPQAFNPYNLEQENYTTLLWWFEGITSYYDDLILYRAKIIDKNRYLQLILDNINNVYKFAGVNLQTLANSSLTSWIKYYRPDENSPNSNVSYYVKGALVGLCLDLFIRYNSHNCKSLDDVLLGLYKKWQADEQGIGENELPHLIKQYVGLDVSNMLQEWVTSCKKLPLAFLLAKFGVKLHSLTKQKYTSNGRILQENNQLPTTYHLDLGCKLVKESFGYKVIHVYANTNATKIGLAANDVIIAINGIKLNDIDKMLGLYKPTDKIIITFFRHEQLLSRKLTLQLNNFTLNYLQVVEEKKLASWL